MRDAKANFTWGEILPMGSQMEHWKTQKTGILKFKILKIFISFTMLSSIWIEKDPFS